MHFRTCPQREAMCGLAVEADKGAGTVALGAAGGR